MRKRILFCVLFSIFGIATADATLTSCGPAYILVESRQKIDGIASAECQKLWCRDLETGKVMGSGDRANSGYQMTGAPVELCDANNKCIECWGARKWCSGEVAGEWNPEYGAYTRGGDNATYQSYQKGSCFAWRLEKPQCAEGQTAIIQDGRWVCAVPADTASGVNRASSVRRTGTMRRLK